MSDEFGKDILAGLTSSKKRISSKYLYDKKGSELFVEITRLEEYYPSNCEKEILETQSSSIIESIDAQLEEIVELGSGDGFKTRYLLEEAHNQHKNLTYTPVDISPDSIRVITENMKSFVPGLKVSGSAGDYFNFLKSHDIKEGHKRKLALFLGSNIGNFSSDNALQFLSLVNSYLQKGDYFLIGMDLKKSIPVMSLAYNDPSGLTSEFNYNVLDRINKELGADFNRDQFYHHGVYNVDLGAMQSFLVSKVEQVVKIEELNVEIEFDRLEPIHIENSCKYSNKDIQQMAKATGFEVIRNFYDSKDYFVDTLWKKV